MKYSILYFIFLLLSICGCKKSSLPGSPLNTLTSGSPNNSDTISHVQSGGWSFQINGGSVLGGDVTTCLVVQGSSSNRHQLIMSGPVANNRYSLALAMDMPSTVPVVGSYVACPSTNNQIQINYEYADNSFVSYLSDSITFNVVSYDPATRAVYATFYGNVNAGLSGMSMITNGSITGIVQQ